MRCLIDRSWKIGLLLVVFVVPCGAGVSVAGPERPKLVLQLTVDQLRGDALRKLESRFQGGFRYLIDRGVWYTNAHYQHSATFTAVGHAILATGGYPAQHGIIGNDWIDRNTGEHVYCYFDPDQSVLGREPSAQSASSPRNLMSSTIADEIYWASGSKAKVFSVSIKDRAAIPCGGHTGKAFWYDKSTGGFTTSTYYYSRLPGWVRKWNDAKPADRYLSQSWKLLHAKETYMYGHQDDRAAERPHRKMGRTFPHFLGDREDLKAFYSTLRFAPLGDVLTLEFARELIGRERIGQSDATDYFSLSLSATDYIGHAFGPFSLEYEDNLLQLDRHLAEFFAYLDQRIGMQNILIAFASDHGTDAIPEYRISLMPSVARGQTGTYPEAHGYENLGGRHYPEKFIAALNEKLKDRFATDQNLVAAFWNPNLYLDAQAVRTAGLDGAAVSQALAQAVLSLNGFAVAIPYEDMRAGRVPQNAMSRKMSNAFSPLRSGDVMIVQKPFWYLYPDAEEFAAMHGSPYTYDTHVPVLFAGGNIKATRLSRSIEPTDVAATIAEYLGCGSPSGCIGRPLVEVLAGQTDQP